MGEWSTLLTAIGGIVSALTWPAVVVAVVFMFRAPLGALLRSDDVSLTGPGGLSLTAKRKVAAAADALVDASKAKGGERLSRQEAVAEADDTRQRLTGLPDPIVLWVDDLPSNNRHERAAMEALGITFVLSTSTDDALKKLEARKFDAIISDMSRPPDDQAGYTLLDTLRGRGDETPFVIYSSSRDPQQFNEAVRRGAVGITNRTSELIHMVVTALKTSQRS